MFDPFKLLRVPYTMDIDKKALDTAYFAAQRQYHPDKSNDNTVSIRLNQAYEMLRHPVERAKTLLEINGLSLPDNDDEVLMEHITLQETPNVDKQALSAATLSAVSKAFADKDWPTFAKETLRLIYMEKL